MVDPLTLLIVASTGVVYVRGARRLRIPPQRAASFGAALAAAAVALATPLAAGAEELFSAHMLQHLLLTVVAAPLAVAARPALALWVGLPARARRVLGRTFGHTRLPDPWSSPRRAVIIWGIATGTLWAWHLPVAYQAALRTDALHGLEHASLFWSSVLLWWAALRSHPDHLPAGVALLFTTALQGGILGALLTFASEVWYPSYAGGTWVFSLGPLADQQVAGLLMWAPPGIIHLAAAVGLLVRWLDTAHDAAPARSHRVVAAGKAEGGMPWKV